MKRVMGKKKFTMLLLGMLCIVPAAHAVVGDIDNDGVPDASDVWPTDGRYSVDSDVDSLPDAWEQYQFGSLTASNGIVDTDLDGLSDLAEFERGSDPQVAETTRASAQRRIPPMIEALTMAEQMLAESTQTFAWKAMGYDDSYVVYMVLFDCTGITDGSCGNSYGSANRIHTAMVSPHFIENAPWVYGAEAASYFHYTTDYVVPATRADATAWAATGTPVVVRFYQKSTADANAGKPSISLLIPGNITNIYYDSTGRRIQKLICPAGGCTVP